MRKPLLVALLAFVAGVALAQPISLDTSSRLEFTDCPAAGGDGGTQHAGKLTVGRYLFRVTGEDAFLCFHAYASSQPDGCVDGGTCWNCASGGEKFPAGFAAYYSVPSGGQAFACRSSGASGDVIFTRSN